MCVICLYLFFILKPILMTKCAGNLFVEKIHEKKTEFFFSPNKTGVFVSAIMVFYLFCQTTMSFFETIFVTVFSSTKYLTDYYVLLQD